MKNIMEKQILRRLEDNDVYKIGDLVFLEKDYDLFGLGIITKVLTSDEIIDNYNIDTYMLSLSEGKRIYSVFFFNGKLTNVFEEDLTNERR